MGHWMLDFWPSPDGQWMWMAAFWEGVGPEKLYKMPQLVSD